MTTNICVPAVAHETYNSSLDERMHFPTTLVHVEPLKFHTHRFTPHMKYVLPNMANAGLPLDMFCI